MSEMQPDDAPANDFLMPDLPLEVPEADALSQLQVVADDDEDSYR